MNRRGIVFLYRLMLGLTIIILGIALCFPISTTVASSMTNLSCSSPSSDFDQAACYALEVIKFLLAGGIIIIGFIVLTKL